MDWMFLVQLVIVLACLGIGGRYGGIGLGAGGGLGVLILVFGFGLKPAEPSITAILIIITVISAVSVLQAVGGLDYLVSIAEKILRKRTEMITIVAPIVTSFFSPFCGTSYVAFSLYPVIAEVAAEAKVRPERPMSATVIAAGVAVSSSPMSAATAGMIAFMGDYAGIGLGQLLSVTLPSFFLGAIIASLSVFKRGKELEEDPEFRRRVAAGEYQSLHVTKENSAEGPAEITPRAKISVAIFGVAVFLILFFGTFTQFLPSWDGEPLPTASLIQMVMFAAALIIMVITRPHSGSLNQGSVFRAGLMGAVAILGVSWMTSTLFGAHQDQLMDMFGGITSSNPMLFGFVIFAFSMVIMSPSATVAAVMPLGMTLGIPAHTLIALMPLCSSDFIIPGANQIGGVALDRTGTTRIGRFVVNHSYIRPGLVMVLSQVFFAYLMTLVVF